MAKITQNSIIQRNDPRVVSIRIGDEMIMMDVDKGNYINLNQTALIIWDQLSCPMLVSKLITYLVERFHVEDTHCGDDTLSCLEEMSTQGLIIIK